ncbi:hypothetical protein SERLA73DRAFT_76370 [Serpula lacrymans var. lacrymans S7.3]|uniref:Kinase n=1 Tax=Serpula lacrymans var. lacrymans (strain S7.3) TaxID=936435 RepID=F8Q5E5_SERL3|nr:hypothetical protein SERLA73DRAFT_76370 [Serpula lacrymans var. lacrymans S7.3]
MIPLAAQVGGHPGVQTTEDGSLLLKPAVPLEIEFYQRVVSESGLVHLRPFVPKFFGTLRLEGKVETTEIDEPLVTDEGVLKVTPIDGSLVLENLVHGFTKPSVIDIKLGTIFYEDSATPEKRARMEKAALETTSFETGVRLTGFQVYTNDSPDPILTRKEYGNSIKSSQLSEGIARFFPVSSPSTPSAGLPRHLLLPILRSLREDVAEIRETLEGVDMRMIGGSLLIVYESDWTRAEEAVKLYELENDSEEMEAENDVEITAGEDNDGEDEDIEDEDEEEDLPVPPYTVKLIDFAHTRLMPGHGPDQGVLMGIGTLLKLLDGRIQEVDKMTP